MKNIIQIVLMSIGLLALSNSCKADCVQIESGPSLVHFQPPASIIIQRDVAVGTIIWSDTVNGDTPHTATTCTTYETENRSNIVGSDTGLKTGNSAVYSTNVSGIGYAISYNQPDFSGTAWPLIKTISPGTNGLAGTTMSMRLIVTGEGSSGNINTGQYTLWTKGTTIYQKTYVDVSSQIIRVACNINNPSLLFPLGDISVADFANIIGYSPEKAKNIQNLGLDCDADANINVSMSGTQNPDVTTTSVLALTEQGSAGTATGIGVQLLYNNTPLELNKNVVLKKSAGGQETFPIVARYYQTQTTVMPGKANASATLNITYQ